VFWLKAGSGWSVRERAMRGILQARHAAHTPRMPPIRPVFYVSDGTGITAETMGHSLLTQFPGVHCVSDRLPFVDSPDKARQALAQVSAAGLRHGSRPIVIASFTDPSLAAVLGEDGALVFNVFEPFLSALEAEFGSSRQPRVGQAHGLVDFESYHRRINAMNYALNHDDGVMLDYREADLVLVGVSRAGKTPTCIYMALHYGIRAANYPLTEEDLERDTLPARLKPYRHKLFGLTIDPERLQQIRSERRPNSRYASAETCRREVTAAEALFHAERIPSLSTTHASIEEIASRVMGELGINREMF
jgi:regulator of PEP synthase PpsR (kinase-PPPase family)